MPKILVADDNSNIQKMVGLALKDQGIDVVAVGNGEAAVRKISDIRPDLVLADVFMPVRNGYEVCNYVKKDSALSHIPVILLVGAFDPLDEQEAQRVGADGVLKKPFVPPDPLISMVKSALTRAGVVLGASEPASVAPPPPPPPVAARPEPAPLPRIAPPPPPPPAPEPEIDLGVPVFSSRPAPLSMQKGEQPLAFGSLLESPAQEEEPVFTSSSGAAIAPDRDWGHTNETEEEAEEVETPNSAWRVTSGIDEAADATPAGQTDWREAAFAGIGAEKKHEWAPSVEKNSLSITEEEAAELARKQNPFVAETVTRAPEDWSKAISSVFPETPATLQAPAAPVKTIPQIPEPVLASASLSHATEEPLAHTSAPTFAEAPAPASEPVIKKDAASSEPATAANSWMAGAVSPWESELQRANDLASSWDSAKLVPALATQETEATQAFLDSGLMATAHEHVVEAIEEVQAEESSPINIETETAAAEPLESLYSPTLHETEIAQEPREAVSQALIAEEPAPADIGMPDAAASVAPPSFNTDDLVAKVLAKMNPDVLQAVTREILKPVIEALVKEELNKK